MGAPDAPPSAVAARVEPSGSEHLRADRESAGRLDERRAGYHHHSSVPRTGRAWCPGCGLVGCGRPGPDVQLRLAGVPGARDGRQTGRCRVHHRHGYGYPAPDGAAVSRFPRHLRPRPSLRRRTRADLLPHRLGDCRQRGGWPHPGRVPGERAYGLPRPHWRHLAVRPGFGRHSRGVGGVQSGGLSRRGAGHGARQSLSQHSLGSLVLVDRLPRRSAVGSCRWPAAACRIGRQRWRCRSTPGSMR